METTESKGHLRVLHHQKGTYFDETFEIETEDIDTGAVTDFDLTDYNGTWKVYNKKGGTALFTATTGTADLVFSGNTYHVNKKIDVLGHVLYFELAIVHKTDTTKNYTPEYGPFINE
jgi:hypothetical protein